MLKGSYTMTKWDLSLGCKDGSTKISVMYHSNRRKNKNNRWRKSIFDKTQLNKLGLEGNYLNVIKAIYEKATANILSGEKLTTSLSSGKRQGCPLSSLLFSILLEVLVRE